MAHVFGFERIHLHRTTFAAAAEIARQVTQTTIVTTRRYPTDDLNHDIAAAMADSGREYAFAAWREYYILVIWAEQVGTLVVKHAFTENEEIGYPEIRVGDIVVRLAMPGYDTIWKLAHFHNVTAPVAGKLIVEPIEGHFMSNQFMRGLIATRAGLVGDENYLATRGLAVVMAGMPLLPEERVGRFPTVVEDGQA